MTDLHDDYDLASDDEFVLAPDNDAMDIMKYHKLVSQNFFIDLPATTEALDASFGLATDVNKHVSDMATGFLSSFTRYVMPSTGATEQSTALAAALPSLQERLLTQLRQRIALKAIVAASDRDMFIKYFPSWALWHDSFSNANIRIADGIKAHYKGVCNELTGWQDHDLGTVMDNIISKSRTSSSKVIKNYMEQRDVLHAVIRCWKGGHQKSILLIVELAKRLEEKAPPKLLKESLGVYQLLYHLYTNFQETGECIIENWQEKRRWSGLCSPATVTQFAREVWPMLPATAKPRIDPEIKGNASFKIRFDAMVKEIGQVDDFYDVSTNSERAEIHAIRAPEVKTDMKTPFQPNDYRLNVSDHFFFRMLKQLAKKPEVCPNCLSHHKFSECNEVSDNPWDNLAAYTLENYRDVTKQNRNKRQHGYWRWISAAPNSK